MSGRPEAQRTLFTVGHSDHEFEAFASLLKQHRVTAVADVRSSPYSRLHPQFGREVLAEQLRRAGVAYVFLGRELGARRHEREAYVGPQASYERIAALPLFREGLDRVRSGVRQYRVALVCAERDPLTCHRAVLICRHLRAELEIGHILPDGGLELHAALERRLLREAGLDGGGLFESPESLLSRAYEAQGRRIAYTETIEDAEKRGVA